ncbi:MAG: alpha/beta hydrolase, partial [Bacteroidota bacterium]
QMFRLLLPLLAVGLSFNVFAQGHFVTLDSTKIWISVQGLEEREEGQPVLVFESGLGTPMDNWDWILPQAAELAPVFVYDRPGIGASEADDELPTVEYVANTLVRLLKDQHIDPPYVLVGHSLGGVYVRGFANYYPDLLAGLVIIDPGDFTETQENKLDYYRVFGWDDERIREEIERLKQIKVNRGDPPSSIQEEKEVLADLRANDFKEIMDQALPNIPVHIITGGRFDMSPKFQSQDYDSETLFRSKMQHRIARWTDVIQSVDHGMLLYSASAGHFVHIDDPGLVVASIRLVLEDAARQWAKAEENR